MMHADVRGCVQPGISAPDCHVFCHVFVRICLSGIDIRSFLLYNRSIILNYSSISLRTGREEKNLKKNLTILFALAMILCMTIAIPAMAEETSEIYPLLNVTKQDLDAGSMFIYDFGPIKLHMYRTGDSMGNVSYLVESETNLVGIEMPAFPENLEAWNQYVISQGKPLDDVFVSIHPAGGSYLTDKNVYGTIEVQESINGGATYSRGQRMSDRNNLNFDDGADVAQVNTIIETEYITVGGITFRIIDHGGSYDVAIPAIRVVCPHQRINNGNHPTLASLDAIDTTLATIHDYLNADYSLLFSAHGGPEGQDTMSERVYYLNTVKTLAADCGSAEEFIEAVQAEFPNYGAVENLTTTAENLFPSAAE